MTGSPFWYQGSVRKIRVDKHSLGARFLPGMAGMLAGDPATNQAGVWFPCALCSRRWLYSACEVPITPRALPIARHVPAAKAAVPPVVQGVADVLALKLRRRRPGPYLLQDPYDLLASEVRLLHARSLSQKSDPIHLPLVTEKSGQAGHGGTSGQANAHLASYVFLLLPRICDGLHAQYLRSANRARGVQSAQEAIA
jgi:hypothetical protein